MEQVLGCSGKIHLPCYAEVEHVSEEDAGRPCCMDTDVLIVLEREIFDSCSIKESFVIFFKQNLVTYSFISALGEYAKPVSDFL